MVLFENKIKSVNIVDGLGAPVADAALHRLGTLLQPEMVDVAEVQIAEKLSGTWLYAGDFWPHFGHFLFESVSRLWAIDHLDQPIDGLIFSSPKPNTALECKDPSFQRDMLRRVGADLPVRILSQNTQVENLIVPRQGCGLGPLAVGTPEFRDFIRDKLRGKIKPNAAKKVYISRLGYRLRRGGLFAESRIEHNLKMEGYQSFSPERVPLDEQIATYMGAEKIVSSDSTALHVVAFLAKEDQDIAILLRRKEGAKDILPNIVGCTGKLPLVIDRIKAFHSRDNLRHPNWSTFAELDFEMVGKDLHAGGFIEAPEVWGNLGFRRQRWLLNQYGEKLSCGFETQKIA